MGADRRWERDGFSGRIAGPFGVDGAGVRGGVGRGDGDAGQIKDAEMPIASA